MATKSAACPEPAEWVQPSFHGASFGRHENLVVGGSLFLIYHGIYFCPKFVVKS